MTMPYRKRALWLMPGDLPPRHLTRWDRTALSSFLMRHGFTVAKIERQSEGIRPILLKLRFRFGSLFSIGLVKHVKQSVKTGDGRAPSGMRRAKVRTAEFLARTKDTILLGIPALIIYLSMLPTPRRFITLFVIAEKAQIPTKTM